MSSVFCIRAYWFPVIVLVFWSVMAGLYFLYPTSASIDGNISDLALEDAPENWLALAESEYWFALADEGDPKAFLRGLGFVDRAATLLQAQCEERESMAYCIRLHNHAEHLKSDFSHHREVYFDTLFGIFPVFALTRGSILLDADATGNYAAIDDPEVIAVTRATRKLASLLESKLSHSPSLHVVVAGVDKERNRRPDLESEVLTLLNRSPRFYVHPSAEVEEIVRREQGANAADDYKSLGKMTTEIRRTVKMAVDADEVIEIRFNEQDTTDDKVFYVVSAHVDTAGKSASVEGASAMGLVHDAGGFSGVAFRVSVVANVLLLIFTGWFAWKQDSTVNVVLVAIVGYVAGRVFPYLVMEYSLLLQPIPNMLLWLSWWWIGFFVFSLFGLPLLLFRVVMAKVSIARKHLLGKLGLVGVGVGSGAIAWATWPVMAYFSPIPALIHLLLAGSASIYLSYLFGRMLDNTDVEYPLSHGVLVALALMVVPAGLFASESAFRWWLGVAGLMLTLVILLVLFRKRRDRQPSVNDTNDGLISLNEKALVLRGGELEQLVRRANEHVSLRTSSSIHLYGEEPELCNTLAKALAERLAESYGSCEVKEVDLMDMIITSGWEPITDLVDIELGARQEAEQQKILDEIIGVENVNSQQIDQEVQAMKALQHHLEARSGMFWVVKNLDLERSKNVGKCLSLIVRRLRESPRFRRKMFVVVSAGPSPLSLTTIAEVKGETTKNTRPMEEVINATQTSSDWRVQYKILPLSRDEMRTLLVDLIKGEWFVDKIIDRVSESSENRVLAWSNVVTWLQELQRNGHLRQDSLTYRLRPTITVDQVDEFLDHLDNINESVKVETESLSEADKKYLCLAACFGETFDIEAVRQVLDERLTVFTALAEYRSLAAKTQWFVMNPLSSRCVFRRSLYPNICTALGLYSEGQPTLLLQEGRRMIGEKLLQLADEDPAYCVDGLRLIYGLAGHRSGAFFPYIEKAFEAVAKNKRADVAKKLLSWSLENQIAGLAGVLGKETAYLDLELWLKAIVANSAFDASLATVVANQVLARYDSGPDEIPFSQLSDLTFALWIARRDCNLYAKRLITEGKERGSAVSQSHGQLWLKPDNETDDDCSTRLEEAIVLLETSSEPGTDVVKAKLLNRRGNVLRSIAQRLEGAESDLTFQSAESLIKASIGIRLKNPEEVDRLGLQMDYQGLGDLYSVWASHVDAMPLRTKTERLENAIKAYQQKLHYANPDNDAFGWGLGLCSLGDAYWRLAWTNTRQKRDQIELTKEAREHLLSALNHALDYAPHLEAYSASESVVRWPYNFQCWALARLSYLPEATGVERRRWRGLLDCLASSCDNKINVAQLMEEGVSISGTANDVSKIPDGIKFRYVFMPPGEVAPEERDPGELWLDIGRTVAPGVLDHHGGAGESTANLVWENENLVVETLRNQETVTVLTHVQPDLDGLTSIWLALRRLGGLARSELEKEIVDRVTRWDLGYVEPLERLEQCWEIVFYEALEVSPDDHARVCLGINLLDLTESLRSRSEDWGGVSLGLLEDFQQRDFAEISRVYEQDESRSEKISLRQLPGFKPSGAAGMLCLSNPLTPASALKVLLKRDGYAGSIVSVQQRKINDISIWRHWIRVDPESGAHLQGLGARLDQLELGARNTFTGALDISVETWYAGGGHHFTIVDSPRMKWREGTFIGSLLTPSQVMSVVRELFA